MATLLVLGSKPAPALPDDSDFDAVACANASGFSAARFGLPDPVFTVLSSVIASGKNPSNRLALQALRGLHTDAAYVYPRPPFRGHLVKRLRHGPSLLQTRPFLLERKLRHAGYRWEHLVFEPIDGWLARLDRLCDAHALAAVARKMPSSGVMAAVLALDGGHWDRVVLSGFSFEITHAYAENPDILRRGSVESRHAETDVAVLESLARRHPLFTTEPVVHLRAGVPMLDSGLRLLANGGL